MNFSRIFLLLCGLNAGACNSPPLVVLHADTEENCEKFSSSVEESVLWFNEHDIQIDFGGCELDSSYKTKAFFYAGDNEEYVSDDLSYQSDHVPVYILEGIYSTVNAVDWTSHDEDFENYDGLIKVNGFTSHNNTDCGRSLGISYPHPYVVSHELGHFFGLVHFNETDHNLMQDKTRSVLDYWSITDEQVKISQKNGDTFSKVCY